MQADEFATVGTNKHLVTGATTTECAILPVRQDFAIGQRHAVECGKLGGTDVVPVAIYTRADFAGAK